MSEQITSAPVQPAFEDMSYSAQAHHLRTAHARRGGTVSPHVHRVLHELVPYHRPYADLPHADQAVALSLAARPTSDSWDDEVHTHREPA